MVINPQSQRNLEKMFEAVLKENFDRWSRKYEHQSVFEVWAEMLGSEGLMPHFKRVGWRVDMTIQEALEALDDYCQEIEDEIRKRKKGK